MRRDERIAEIEAWILGQGRVILYDDRHHPVGWMAFALPPSLDRVTANPPIGIGPTRVDALEALCMVLTGEPALPPW
jgi:hypothetical protein